MEEVKLAIKPFYAKGQISKDEYKDIMRKAVPKVNITQGLDTIAAGLVSGLRFFVLLLIIFVLFSHIQ